MRKQHCVTEEGEAFVIFEDCDVFAEAQNSTDLRMM